MQVKGCRILNSNIRPKITPSLSTELHTIVNFDTMMSKCIKKKMNAFANLRFL